MNSNTVRRQPSRSRSRSRTRTIVVQNAPPRQARSRSRSASRSRQPKKPDLVTDFFTSLFQPMTDPRYSTGFLFSTILVVLFIYLHLYSGDSWLIQFAEKLIANPVFKPLGEFIKQNPNKILGTFIFLPVIFSAPPRIFISGNYSIKTPSRLFIFLLAALFCLWMKEFQLTDYWIQALGLILMLHMKSNEHRLVVVAFLVVAWLLSYATKPVDPTPTTTTPVKPKTK